MRPMGCGKGVIDVKFAKGCNGFRHTRIVFLFTWCKATVFDHNNATIWQGINRIMVRHLHETDISAENFSQRRDHRFQRILHIRFALRPSKMGEQQDFGPAIRQFGDGWNNGFQPRVISDLAVRHRHVQVHPDQAGFSCYVSEIIQCFETIAGHFSEPF